MRRFAFLVLAGCDFLAAAYFGTAGAYFMMVVAVLVGAACLVQGLA